MIQVLPEAEAIGGPTESIPTRIRQIARQWWWIVLAAAALLVVGGINAATGHSTQPYHFRNPEPRGMMALAEILGDEGVEVVGATSLDDLRVTATAGVTVFVPDLAMLTDEEVEAVRALPSDITIGGGAHTRPNAFTDVIQFSSAGSATAVPAECTDPDAAAASRISGTTGSVFASSPDTSASLCFPTGLGTFGYAVWDEDGRTIRYVADRSLFTNERLAADGNAALGLRSLGHNEQLIWYQPAEPGAGIEDASGFAPLAALPPHFGPLFLIAAGTIVLLAMWLGRRMGPVVVEPLPVVVKPGEAVYGRGRLYHRAGSTGHAAAGLRAGTARRLSKRLGLQRSALPQELVDAVALATRRPADQIGQLLYGPPPTTSAELVQLAAALKELEESAR
ncbi:MAG TPA: DUF4350 domain-containing protein [Actinomycetaceae bacterium]|nr:DUF4350 domain-containing protein [Actinomycetaceae bacterium]